MGGGVRRGGGKGRVGAARKGWRNGSSIVRHDFIRLLLYSVVTPRVTSSE